MQFRFSAAAALAFIASVIAQTEGFDSVTSPASGQTVTAGESLTLEWSAPGDWSDSKWTVTIGLIGGATQNGQIPLLTVASGVQNNAGTYTWSIPSTLGGLNFYGFTFTLDQDTSVLQYSNPFNIEVADEQTAAATTDATSTVTADSGVKTISLSSQPAGYTTVVPVYETTTVPCTNSTTTPGAYVPPPAATTIVEVPHSSNGTWTTAVVPAGTTTGSYPVATTPAATTVVTGAGARVGASMAVVGGLVLAALAL